MEAVTDTCTGTAGTDAGVWGGLVATEVDGWMGAAGRVMDGVVAGKDADDPAVIVTSDPEATGCAGTVETEAEVGTDPDVTEPPT